MNQSASPVKLLMITASGGALEFFDFTLFMLFAPYLRQAFFPEAGGLGMLGVMGMFFAGYLARPLGGLVFSTLGDRYGRKKQFVLCVAIMSLCTLGIGVLPPRAVMGDSVILALILLRVLQGASLGGEIPASVTYMAEWLPRHRRGRYIGVIITAITCGNLAGALCGYFLTTRLSTEEMQAWGWRLPFVLGFVLGVILLIARSRMQETPVFMALKDSQRVSQQPVRDLLSGYGRRVLQGIGIAAVPAVMVSFYLYLPVWFSQHLKFSLLSSFSVSTLAFLVMCIQVPFYGYLSDRFGRRPLLLIGCILLLPALWLSYMLLSAGPFSMTILGVIVLTAIPAAMVQSTYETAMVELFPAWVRFSGLGLSHNVGFALFGGLAPVVMESLLVGGIIMGPLLVVATGVLITFCASVLLREGKPQQEL